MKTKEQLWDQLKDDMERWYSPKKYHDTPTTIESIAFGVFLDLMERMEEQNR